MALRKFLAMAYRSVIRNTRRSLLTALAVALGLVVVMVMSGFIEGAVDNALRDNIRISSGHLQIREESYETDKASLLAKDLLRDGDNLAMQAEAVDGVQSAAPVLWSGGLLSTPRESIGIEKFSGSVLKQLFNELDRMITVENQVGVWYEAAFQNIIDDGAKIYPVDVGELVCMELDTHEDLERAASEVVPILNKNK